MYLKIKPKKSSRDQYEGFVYPQTVNLSGNHRCCWNMCIRPAIIVRYILIQFSSNRRLWCPTDCCDIRRSPERCDNRADSSVVVAPVCSLCDIWFEKWRIFLWKLLIPKLARKKGNSAVEWFWRVTLSAVDSSTRPSGAVQTELCSRCCLHPKRRIIASRRAFLAIIVRSL